MKKTILFFLIFILLFSFAACGDKENQEQITEPTTLTEEATDAIPENAVSLVNLPDFNGYIAQFSYADAVFYVKLTQDNNESKTLPLTLPAALSDDILSAEGKMMLADMNFDGKTDIGLLYNAKKDNRQYYCFLWNERTKNLVYNASLSALTNIGVDKEAKFITAAETDGGDTVTVFYKWNNEILKRDHIEEPTTEKPTEPEITTKDVADAVQGLFGIDEDEIKKAGTDKVNGATVTVFSVDTDNETVHIAADSIGNIYIDEDRDGDYQYVDKKNGKYYIGPSIDSDYDSDDFNYFAKEIAALEVGKENVGNAVKTGTDYVEGRYVLVYEVSIYDGAGSVTVAFDDTLEYYYLLSSSGDYNPPEENESEENSTQNEEPATTEDEEEIIFPE